MKKNLVTPSLINELKGESSFFKPTPTSKRRHDVTTSQKKKKDIEKSTSQSPTTIRPYNKYELWKEIITDADTQNTTVRLTKKESNNVSDFTRNLRREKNIRISMNELARLGLLFLMDDFNDNGEKSVISKVKGTK
jgi:hypothetical protein